MGGEGSMQAMKSILQNNRNLLRRKRMFDEKNNIKNSNTKLEFKEITLEDLEKVKETIREKAKKEQKIHKVILVLLTIVVISALYFLMKDFSIDFNSFFRQI